MTYTLGLLLLQFLFGWATACKSNASKANLRKPYIQDSYYLVDTKYGTLLSKNGSNYLAFYGIPYAEAPIGDLRWQKPKNPKSWSGVKNATDQAAVKGCPQKQTLNSPPIIDEDCLFLNIFTPLPEDINNSKLKSRPVMFWIHGGSFTNGASSIVGYDGSYLAAEYGVIVVTINYRLGSMGFLYDSGQSGEIVGNQGIWDMLKALDYVKENIEAFYGDKNKITIFGQSAGGQAVSTLFSLKENAPNNYHNSFQQAILQSAPLGLSFRNKTQATEESQMLLKNLDCPNWSCAKSRPWPEIINAQNQVRAIIDNDKISSLVENWTPVIDNILLDLHPLDSISSGRNKNKKAIFGHTNGEGDIFVYSVGKDVPLGRREYILLINTFFNGLQKYNQDADAVLKKFPSRCKDFDPGCSNRKLLSQVASSYLFDCPMRVAIKNRTSYLNLKDQKNWKYLFSQPVYEIPGFPKYAKTACSKVACHSAELPYVFNSFDKVDLSKTHAEALFSERMMFYWTNFAATGDPNLRDDRIPKSDKISDVEIEYWPDFGEIYYTQELFSQDYTPNIRANLIDEYCNFWDELDSYLLH